MIMIDVRQWFFGAVLVTLLGGGGVARGADDERLALQGYDPVAYFTMSKAVLGDPNIQMEWDGAIYRFASASDKDLFKADPDRYLPQYGSLCTASLAAGRKFAADPRHWLVHEGRLYLFGGPSGPEDMSKNPEAINAQAQANFTAMVSAAGRQKE